VEVLRYRADGWGVGELAVEDETLLYHELPAPPPRESHSNRPQGMREIPVVTLAEQSERLRAGLVAELVQRLMAYFAGSTRGFDDVALELDWCTPFQHSLVAALRSVRRGELVTYRELASLAGRPNAQRAAGSFCAANRFGIVVPCHRVVAERGLGGYGSLGLSYKRRLLALEGAALSF
jgi:methylated-DNA-[protein]-cysteine S-methyltransferase